MEMAELGCQHATIPEDILQQLSLLDLQSNPPAGDYSTKHPGEPSPRLAHLVETDSLSGPTWDGKLARTDVDYLADNGAALSEAISTDKVTERGLHEALEAFKANELQSKTAIEEILAQF